MIERLTREMLVAAEKLEFELAATLRDRILDLESEPGPQAVTSANTPPPGSAPRRSRKRGMA